MKNSFLREREVRTKILFVILAIASIFTTPAIALFAGLFFAFFWKNPYKNQTKKLSKKLLQYSVIGLGFGMNFHDSLQSGKEGMLFTVVSVVSVMALGMLLGKFLKLNRCTSYLISSGTAICGGSAIAAVAPLTKSSESEISVSLATVFVLNAVALFIFPPIGHWLGMSQEQFGTWAAIAIHDTSSVVGAGAAYGEKALQIATTVKLTRALWIIPLAFVTALIFREKTTKVSIPWFIFFFVLAMLFNTYLTEILEGTDFAEYWAKMAYGLVFGAKKMLILTLFLIGVGLSRSELKTVGVKPMILGVLLWIFIGIVSLWAILWNY